MKTIKQQMTEAKSKEWEQGNEAVDNSHGKGYIQLYPTKIKKLYEQHKDRLVSIRGRDGLKIFLNVVEKDENTFRVDFYNQDDKCWVTSIDCTKDVDGVIVKLWVTTDPYTLNVEVKKMKIPTTPAEAAMRMMLSDVNGRVLKSSKRKFERFASKESENPAIHRIPLANVGEAIIKTNDENIDSIHTPEFCTYYFNKGTSLKNALDAIEYCKSDHRESEGDSAQLLPDGRYDPEYYGWLMANIEKGCYSRSKK